MDELGVSYVGEPTVGDGGGMCLRSMCSWCLMLLVTQASAHLLVRIAVWVHCCRWSPLTVVLVLLVLHLMIWVLVRCLMGDFLC
jgi:hypothetical protein